MSDTPKTEEVQVTIPDLSKEVVVNAKEIVVNVKEIAVDAKEKAAEIQEKEVEVKEKAVEQKDVTVMVTGCAGYLASHIVARLLKKGYKVLGTTRNKEDNLKHKHLLALPGASNKTLRLIDVGLLDDKDTWFKAVSGCTYVVRYLCIVVDSLYVLSV